MALDMELQGKPKSEALIEAATASNKNVTVTQDSVPKSMPCASNCEDTKFNIESALDVAAERKVDEGENVVVDITGCTKVDGFGQLDGAFELEDSTENSSSFGGTFSGTENGAALSDGEVDSQDMVGPFYLHGFPDESQVRKKLTDHWRRFIHPLSWRCKWLELQIREFQSRAVEYDKLAEYEHQKHLAFDNVTSEGFNSKSLAFSGQVQRKNVLKRKRRRKFEQTVDLASYMSKHNLFSHYEKRLTADSLLAKECRGNQAAFYTDDSSGGSDAVKLDLGHGDTYMEQILAKIYKLQSEVRKLKTQIEKVIIENPGRFSSTSRNPPSPLPNEHQSPSQHQSDCDIGDLLVADASSHQGMASLSDVRESTSQEEMLKIEDFKNEPPENPENYQEQLEDQSAISPAKVEEAAALLIETPSPLEAYIGEPRPPLKTYMKRKRRRGESHEG